MAQDRADLAVLLGSQLFPSDRPSHPIFSSPDTAAWRHFLSEESHFEVHPPAKGFAGVSHSFGVDQFQSVSRHIFLAHELGHYLAGFPQSEKILVRLKTSCDVLQEVEASADLIGAVLTVAALSHSVDFQRPGAMTWLVAKTNLLLQIHHAFVEVRRIVKKVAKNPGMADLLNPAPEPDNRAKLVARELANPDTVRNLFRLGGSRAKVIGETLAHHQKYARIVVNSILQSAVVMAETIFRAWKIVKPPSASESWRISADELDAQAVLWLVRQSLGDDIFRVLSVFSNQVPQAPWNRQWSHPSTDGLSLNHVDLRGQRSIGMKKLPLTNGILLDVSDWRLEPV